MTTATQTKITRSSAGMVEALFDTIDRLNNKQIDAEHARAVSHTARTIVGIATLELDVRKFEHEGVARDGLKSLSIEGTKE